METALGWLGDVFRAILKVFPCLVLVRATHAGVKFRHGSDVIKMTHENGARRIGINFWGYVPFPTIMRTGVHFVWPLVTEHEVVPIKRQTINLVQQYLSTGDNKKVGVGGIVVYEVSDVEKLLTECHDYDETIQDISLSGIKKVITSREFNFLLKQNSRVDAELTKTLRKDLSRFGIKVIKVTLSDFAETKMIALWGVSF